VDEPQILRSENGAGEPLAFSLRAGSELHLDGRDGRLRVLRRERSGLIVLHWGECVVTGLLARDADGDVLEIESHGHRHRVRVRGAAVDAMEQRLHAGAQHNGPIKIVSPIPGLVKDLRAKAGDAVKAGQTLVVLEAMKMENQIAAPHDGTVDSVHVAAGKTVPAGATLLVLRT
jgi:biotin carboxyl carrier protein